MKTKKIYCFVIFLFISIYIIGCGSGSYTVNDEIQPQDTSISKLKIGDSSSSIIVNVQKTPPKTWLIRSAPTFTLQLNGSYNYGVAELTYDYETVYETQQFLEGQNFGVRRGFTISLVGKLPIEKKGNIRFLMQGAYSLFQNNELTSLVSSTGKVKYQIISIGAGIENCFTPSFRWKPYVSLLLTANLISGKAENIENLDGTTSNYKFTQSLRLGYTLNTGVEYLLSNNVGLNFAISIVDANRILKSSKESSDPNEIPIRDKKLDYPLTFSGYKQFVFTAFALGFNYYFGVKGKTFKF